MGGKGYTVGGWVILALSLMTIVASFDLDRTAAWYSDTLNLGLLQDQMMLLHLGIGGAMSGIILIGFGGVIGRLTPLSTRDTAIDPEQDEVDREAERESKQRNFAILSVLAVIVIVALVILGDQGLL